MSAYRPNPSRIAALDELEVQVEKLIQGGDGLAREDGLPILIPLSAPGDRLRVRVLERKPDYARAQVLEILEPGPARREPPCRYFGRCGGCDLQHIDDEAQLAAKVSAARETLERLGGVRSVSFEVHGGSPWAYRSQAQIQVRTDGDVTQVGFHSRGSHDLVAIDRCPVLAEELESLLPDLPRILGDAGEAVPSRLDLASLQGKVVVAPPVPGLASGELEVAIGEFRYEYDARCFFQVNLELVPDLVRVALADHRGERAVDLYAGVGLFSLPLSKSYDRVVAVESDRIAVRFGRRNLRLNGVNNVEFVGLRVESALDSLGDSLDRVVVDPPRSGLPKRVRATLLEKLPRRITYVSCQPATLARDLKILSEEYAVEEVHFFDLFPQTGHLESVAQLRLKRDAEVSAGGAPAIH